MLNTITSRWDEHRLQEPNRHVFVPYYTSHTWLGDYDDFVYFSTAADLSDTVLAVYSPAERRTIRRFPIAPPNGGSFGGGTVSAVTCPRLNLVVIPCGRDLVGVSLLDGAVTTLYHAPDPAVNKLGCGTLSPDGSLLAYGCYAPGHASLIVFSLPDFTLRFQHDFGSFHANHFQFLSNGCSILYAHEGKTEGIDDRLNRLDLDTDTTVCLHRHYRDLKTGDLLECIGHEMAASQADLVCAVRYPVSRIPGAVIAVNNDGQFYREIDQDDFWHVSCNPTGTLFAADTMWWGHSSRKQGGIIDILLIDTERRTKEVVKTIHQQGGGQHQHPHPHTDAAGRQVMFMECSDENRDLASLTLRVRLDD